MNKPAEQIKLIHSGFFLLPEILSTITSSDDKLFQLHLNRSFLQFLFARSV